MVIKIKAFLCVCVLTSIKVCVAFVEAFSKYHMNISLSFSLRLFSPQIFMLCSSKPLSRSLSGLLLLFLFFYPFICFTDCLVSVCPSVLLSNPRTALGHFKISTKCTNLHQTDQRAEGRQTVRVGSEV